MFSYLGVLISVILGLALTHLLVGVSKLVQMRRTVRTYWVHVVWAVNVLMFVLAVWWGMFWWNKLEVWTIEQFLFITGYSIVLFMLASMLFPSEFPEEIDFEEYFYANKAWFFGILLAATLIDIPETLEKGVAHLRDVPRQYVLYVPATLALVVTALCTRNRRLHAVLAVGWLVLLLAYLAFTSLSRIAAA